MKIRIEAFKEGEMMPQDYTCDGHDTMPTITITGTPEETVSLALIVDDPDATVDGTWNHCTVYNIPPETKEIHKENLETFTSGLNSWGNEWYGGPCPPEGSNPHRYIFTVYALRKSFRLEQPPTAKTLLEVMKPHTVTDTSYLGLYSRNTR